MYILFVPASLALLLILVLSLGSINPFAKRYPTTLEAMAAADSEAEATCVATPAESEVRA